MVSPKIIPMFLADGISIYSPLKELEVGSLMST
jgi:hypothetical protein